MAKVRGGMFGEGYRLGVSFMVKIGIPLAYLVAAFVKGSNLYKMEHIMAVHAGIDGKEKQRNWLKI